MQVTQRAVLSREDYIASGVDSRAEDYDPRIAAASAMDKGVVYEQIHRRATERGVDIEGACLAGTRGGALNNELLQITREIMRERYDAELVAPGVSRQRAAQA